MKKSFIMALGALFAGAAFAQHYERPDVVLTAEQVKMTADAAPKKLHVKPKKIRNFLVWSRTEGYRHTEGIPAFNELMKVLVARSDGMWKVKFSEDVKDFELENLKKYDCVIINNCTGRFFESYRDEREKMSGAEKNADTAANIKYRDNLIKYVEEGGGIMGMHAACDAMDCKDNSNPGEKFPAYPVMMGGRFAGHPWGAGNSAVTVLVEDPSHPTLLGLWENNEFKIQDEIYTFIEEYGYDRDKQRILLSLDFDRSPKDGGRDPMLETQRKNKDFGLSWVKKFGKGRIFYGAFGHRLDVYWRNPKICEMYMRGLQYASGDLPADATPLGSEAQKKALAAASVNAVKTLRDINYGDSLGPIETVFFRAYQAISESPETASQVEKICVSELKAKSGTNRYRKILSELLQVTAANSTAADVGEIIARDCVDKDPKSRFYTESLFISLARSKDKDAVSVLKKLSSNKADYIARDAVTALSYHKDSSILEFLKGKFASANKSGDTKMAWTAASAIARLETPNTLPALADAYKSAKNPMVKNLCAELIFANGERNKPALEKFANEIASDKNAPVNLRTLAAIELVKKGKVSGGVLTRDVIRVLGENKSVKIPAELSLANLPEEDKAEMIYALVKRGEGLEDILKVEPKTAGTAVAITEAISKFGVEDGIAKAVSFVPLYERNNDFRNAAFILASAKIKNKLQKFTTFSEKLEGRERDFMKVVISELDSSSAADFIFGIIKGNADESVKAAAFDSLKNAVLKNSEVFVRTAEIYNTLPKGLNRPAMGLMVTCSRRACDDDMVAAATKLFDSAKTPAEKSQFMRFASANNSDAGVKMCLHAFKSNMQKQALSEISKWNNETALEPLVSLDKSLKNPEGRKAVQSAIVTILANAGLPDHSAADYIIKNAVQKSDAKKVEKLRRLNLANFKMEELPNGIKGTCFKNSGELKSAFDGNLGSRWSSGESRKPGQWIQFELPKVRFLSEIHLNSANSAGDVTLNPKLFAGETLDDFDEVKCDVKTEKGVVILKFNKPRKVKMVRVENNGEGGNWWSIHEVVFVNDPSVYKEGLKKVANGISASSSSGANPKDAFDGNINSRWSTNAAREPGQWFMIAFDNPRSVSEIALLLGDSTGDRVLSPTVFAGDSVEKMDSVKINYKRDMKQDTLKLEKPVKAKYFRIENNKQSGGYWSIHEIEVK